ncbi:MAG TPA: hypothetical protein ENG87_00830 [Candidatus Pacearchaeota archaeon]|nr:hypothetical protein [Candidatus Pacearchaeota archaeon]
MKPKNITNSKILIGRRVGEGIDGYGRKFIKINWEEAKGETNLGSCAKPNKDIELFKIECPDDRPSFLEGLFSGRR